MPRKRLLLLLFLFILTTLSIMTYQSNREPFLPLKFLQTSLNKFHDVKKSVTDFITSPFKRILIREKENIRLKTEIAKLIQERQRYQEVLQENKRLKELLQIKEQENRYIVTTRILAKSTDQWSNTLILDKGLSDGIAKNMIAVTEKGLVGKISGVSDSYSNLLLLSDINFSIAARLQESRIEGIITGTGFRKCKLKYIPYEEEIKKGDIVITSGLDYLFPPGIPIGHISKINKKGVSIFLDIEVTPFVDNKKVEFVVIMKRE